MSSPRSSRWARGSAARAGSVDPQLRVSDAERAEVADRLSKHYSDGRLDQAEFDERLDQAMKAKTQADLAGLFTDLPVTGGPGNALPQPSGRPGNGHPFRRIVGLVLIVVVTLVLWHALAVSFVPFFFWHVLGGSFVPWLLVGLVVFLWLRHGPGSRHRP
jgi:hypothetical protein